MTESDIVNPAGNGQSDQLHNHTLNGPIGTVIMTMIRGIAASVGPQLPPEILMRMISYQVGLNMGRMMAGDLALVLRARKDLQDEFRLGLQKAGVNTVPAEVINNVAKERGQQ